MASKDNSGYLNIWVFNFSQSLLSNPLEYEEMEMGNKELL